MTFLSWVSGKALVLNDLSNWQESRQCQGFQGRALTTEIWVCQEFGTEGKPQPRWLEFKERSYYGLNVCLPRFTC